MKFGSGALNLDQSGTEEYLTFTNEFNFDGSSAWSMSWWGKRSASALGSQGMITGTTGSSNDFVWTPDNPSVVQGLRLRDSSGTSLDYGGIVDDNAYHHWAVSYDGSGQVTVWRDNSVLGGGPAAFSGDILMQVVGAGTASKNNSFYGQIDELYIFDETIDSTIVGNLFNSNTIPEPGSLVLLGLGGLLLGGRRRRA